MAKILCRRQICMNFCPVCELSEQIGKRTNCNLRSLRRERKHLSTETEIRMTEYGTGCLVRSLAGHDKGTYYIIVREDARYVYLADGRTKTAAKPKRKKRKHVQFSHKWDEALAAQFADGSGGCGGKCAGGSVQLDQPGAGGRGRSAGTDAYR